MKAISGRFEMQVSPLLSLSPSSPSFNSYSSSNLAEIAARVVQELRIESEISADSNIFDWDDHTDTDTDNKSLHPPQHQEDNKHYNYNIKEEEEDNNNNNDEDEDEDEFEFAFVCREPESSPISADEIFYNGQIKPTYPLFDMGLVLNQETVAQNTTKKSTRSPLRKLFSEDNETTTTSCSSSEADDLEGLNPGTYCVWTPKKAESSPGRCKKSSSTGSSSKRWKFKDLLHRSNSDGKETFVYLAPNSKKSSEEKANTNNKEVIKGVVEEHYVRNRAIKEGDKRKSFLPYKQDLMGFFSNVNGLSRNLHPF